MEENVLLQKLPVNKYLSESELLRKRIKVNEQVLENIIFKIAETQNELE